MVQPRLVATGVLGVALAVVARYLGFSVWAVAVSIVTLCVLVSGRRGGRAPLLFSAFPLGRLGMALRAHSVVYPWDTMSLYTRARVCRGLVNRV